MAGDFSRSSLNPTKNYAGVLMQQGRVQVDADWNEQLALQRHRDFVETRDVIGRCGTLKHHDGFKIYQDPVKGLFILPGRFYVDGFLCEWDPEVVEIGFPDRPGYLGPPVGFDASARAVQTGRKISGGVPGRPSRRNLMTTTSQVIVPSNIVDGRPLTTDDWVVITTEQGPAPLYTKIAEIDANPTSSDPNSIAPNSYTLTLYDSVAGFYNSGPVRLSRALTLTTQPYLASQMPNINPAGSGPASGNIEFSDGLYVIFLETWLREVNALEDPHIREVALGGPDTAERLQTVWQVQVLPLLLSPPSPSDCSAGLPDYETYKAGWRTTSLMNARTVPPTPDKSLCAIPPAAGYQSLENQLYRVEIFRPSSDSNGPTFVWSRDNGSVETSIVSIDSSGNITVPDLGKDDLHTLAVNDWVEIIDPHDEFQNNPRFLYSISNVSASDSGPVLAVTQPSSTLPTQPASNYANKTNLRLRRWDMPQNSATQIGVAIAAGWLNLENNIQVNFTSGRLAPRAYWQIPARTATGDIEWPPFASNVSSSTSTLSPIPQPPMGVAHHFCKLALLDVVDGVMNAQDCRTQFPSLTHICADDVCYETDCPDLADAKTVQEALDELCEQEDLKFHKKELHGWGVVCGLQVTCGPNGGVTVQKGYAIDCQGDDILIKQPMPFDVISNIPVTSPGAIDGQYSLLMDPSANNELRLVAYTSPSEASAIFDGGIWSDFYTNYLKWFADYFQTISNQPVPPDVTLAQKFQTSLINLFRGSHVYISIDEHEVMGKIFGTLLNHMTQGLAADQTFCALRSEVGEFPGYPGAIKTMQTIFGTGKMSQLRLSSDGAAAFAVGAGSAVEYYDLARGRLQATLLFPAANAVVMDVGVSPNNNTLYAIATINNGKDSVFAVKPINSSSSDWQSTTFPNTVFSRIAVDSDSNRICVSAVGAGLYSFSISATTPGSKPMGSLISDFNAIGHLVAQNGFAYATLILTATSHMVVQIRVRGDVSIIARFEIPNQALVSSTDDLALAPETTETEISKVYVSAGPPAGSTVKNLYIVKFGTAGQRGSPVVVPLEANDTIRFAYNTNNPGLQLSYHALCKMRLLEETEAAGVNPGTAQFVESFYPTEADPISMQFSTLRKEMLLLNLVSDSITVIRGQAKPWTTPQLDELLSYRQKVIEAFLRLIDGFVQYLKDGFCYLLLRPCPECGGDETIGLAVITVQDQKVFKICNLSGRKYVKTFPNVAYWLSIVPIFPILKYLLSTWCCSIVSQFLAPKQPSGSSSPGTTLTGLPFGTFTDLANRLKGASIGAVLSGINRALSVKILAKDYLLSLLKTPAPSGAKTQLMDLVGQPAGTAQDTLGANNISMSTLPYDPTMVAENVETTVTAPSQVEAGSSVTAFVDQDQTVRYFSVTPPGIQKAEATSGAAVASLEEDVSTVKSQLASLQQSQSIELAKRDQLIAMLTQQLQAQTKALSDLNTLVQALSKKKGG